MAQTQKPPLLSSRPLWNRGKRKSVWASTKGIGDVWERDDRMNTCAFTKISKFTIDYYLCYIHNWLLQPFSQDYWACFSHHLCYVCVNFNDKFFEKLFMAILFILRVFSSYLLRGNRRRNTFCILLSCLAWGSNPGLRLISQHTTNYGDFSHVIQSQFI